MNASCPICDIEYDFNCGEQICTSCKSHLYVYDNGFVELVKSKKRDNSRIYEALIPLLIVAFFNVRDFVNDEFDIEVLLVMGWIFVLYPLLTFIHGVYHDGWNHSPLMGLYVDFFKRELHRLDNRSIIGFYIMLLTNILGITMITISIVT